MKLAQVKFDLYEEIQFTSAMLDEQYFAVATFKTSIQMITFEKKCCCRARGKSFVLQQFSALKFTELDSL